MDFDYGKSSAKGIVDLRFIETDEAADFIRNGFRSFIDMMDGWLRRTMGSKAVELYIDAGTPEEEGDDITFDQISYSLYYNLNKYKKAKRGAWLYIDKFSVDFEVEAKYEIGEDEPYYVDFSKHKYDLQVNVITTQDWDEFYDYMQKSSYAAKRYNDIVHLVERLRGKDAVEKYTEEELLTVAAGLILEIAYEELIEDVDSRAIEIIEDNEDFFGSILSDSPNIAKRITEAVEDIANIAIVEDPRDVLDKVLG